MEEEGVELELGLSLGGSYVRRSAEKPAKSSESGDDERKASEGETKEEPVADPKTDLGSGERADPMTKREIHALRRREAKRKREAKQQRRGARPSPRNGKFPNGEQDLERTRTEELVSLNLSIDRNGGSKSLCSHFGAGGHQFPAPRFSPCVRSAAPCWEGDISKDMNLGGSSSTGRSFRPYRLGRRDSDLKPGGGRATEQRFSASGSSSEVSDPHSSSFPGSSCDSGSDSGHARPINGSVSSNTSQSTRSHQTETAQSSDASPPAQPSPPVAVVTESSAKPPKPAARPAAVPLGLGHVPRVTTKGAGLNGRRVDGFLHRYTKSEVSILCVCHGMSFSPADFVRHAGGGDVAHPLRHITVVSSPI